MPRADSTCVSFLVHSELQWFAYPHWWERTALLSPPACLLISCKIPWQTYPVRIIINQLDHAISSLKMSRLPLPTRFPWDTLIPHVWSQKNSGHLPTVLWPQWASWPWSCLSTKLQRGRTHDGEQPRREKAEASAFSYMANKNKTKQTNIAEKKTNKTKITLLLHYLSWKFTNSHSQNDLIDAEISGSFESNKGNRKV